MPSPFYLPFDYSYHYPDHPDGVLIPVSLESGQIFHKTFASIDPGASVCLFSREIGELLGLDIEQGLYTRLSTLTGGLDAMPSATKSAFRPSTSPFPAQSTSLVITIFRAICSVARAGSTSYVSA